MVHHDFALISLRWKHIGRKMSWGTLSSSWGPVEYSPRILFVNCNWLLCDISVSNRIKGDPIHTPSTKSWANRYRVYKSLCNTMLSKLLFETQNGLLANALHQKQEVNWRPMSGSTLLSLLRIILISRDLSFLICNKKDSTVTTPVPLNS